MDIRFDRKLHISFPNMTSPELHDITTGIESGSASISEIISQDDNIQFGSYNVNKFEITLYGVTNLTNQLITVWIEPVNQTAVVGYAIAGNAIVGNTYQELPRIYLFTGYVDSCKLDNFGYSRRIVAYDILYYLRDTNVSQWWENFWSTRTSATLSTIRNSLCDFASLNYDNTKTYFNDSLSIPKPELEFDNFSFSQILTYICELQCIFPNITRTGDIEFISLDPNKVTTHNIVNGYEQLASEFEDYQVYPIDTVSVESDGEVVYKTVTAGLSQYTISDNIFLYEFTDSQLISFVNSYLTEASKITYIPASVKLIVSDFSIKLGDIVHTSKGDVYVLNNDYSGSLLIDQTVRATGDRYRTEVYNSYNIVNSRIFKKINDVSTELGNKIIDATKSIVGQNGGYVVLNDFDGDELPDELLIMDTPDITTATKVWRWNSSGLGYSSTGYNGTYGLAMTSDGQIVADYITTGTMSANRILGGLLKLGGYNNEYGIMQVYSETDGLELKISKNGMYIYRNGTFAGQFTNIYTDNAERMTISNGPIITSTDIRFTDDDSDYWVGYRFYKNGGFRLYMPDGTQYAGLDTNTRGGYLALHNLAGNQRVGVSIDSSDGGSFHLYDTNGNDVVRGYASTGRFYAKEVYANNESDTATKLQPILKKQVSSASYNGYANYDTGLSAATYTVLSARTSNNSANEGSVLIPFVAYGNWWLKAASWYDMSGKTGTINTTIYYIKQV